MARYQNYSCTCKNCQNSFKAKKYELIDRSDKALVKDLFDLSLFKRICPVCHNSFSDIYDLNLYDRRGELLLLLRHSDQSVEETVKQLEAEDGEFERYKEDNQIRIVRNVLGLREKLLIFDEDLDDRVIELMKVDLRNRNHLNTEAKLFFVNTDKGYGFSDEEGKVYLISDSLMKDLETLELPESYLIDQSWAEEVYAESWQAYQEDHRKKEADKAGFSEVNKIIAHFYELCDAESEEAASYFISNWENILYTYLEAWKKEYHKEGKPKAEELNALNQLYTFTDLPFDADIALCNSKEYAFRRDFHKELLEKIDLSDKPLLLYNTRRFYGESLEETDSAEAYLDYILKWEKEEPESLYVKATLIDYYSTHNELDKAEKLIREHLHDPFVTGVDEWFYDAAENLCYQTGDNLLFKEINTLRTRRRLEK